MTHKSQFFHLTREVLQANKHTYIHTYINTHTCEVLQVQDESLRQVLQKIKYLSAYNSISNGSSLRHSACNDYVHHFITSLSHHILWKSSHHFQQSGLIIPFKKSDNYVAHATAICRNPMIHNFTGATKTSDLSSTDRQLSLLCFYDNLW